MEQATLIIGPRWVGDMVMAQSLFMALKARDPHRPIDVMAPAWARPLLSRMPEVRAALAAPSGAGRLDLMMRLRAGRQLAGLYDRAYVLPGSWKSALVPFAARVRQRTGYRREFRYGLLNDIVALRPALKRRTALSFELLARPAEIADDAVLQHRPRLAVDPANQSRLFAEHGLAAGAYLALMPGAEFGPAKRWPARHYAAFAQEAARRGWRCILLGSPKDREAGAEIRALAPDVIDLTGATRLEDAIDLLAGARGAVTNDSGLMHVAAAVGTAVIGVFGSTSADNTPPLTNRAEIVSLRLACSPCHKKLCPLGHLDCLEKLDPARVIAAAERLGAL